MTSIQTKYKCRYLDIWYPLGYALKSQIDTFYRLVHLENTLPISKGTRYMLTYFSSLQLSRPSSDLSDLFQDLFDGFYYPTIHYKPR